MARGQYRLSLLLASLLLVAVASDALLGGWSPIEDVKNPHVQEIGKFAVEAHNKLTATKLKFQSVIKGQTQVVAGTNYRLTVMAKNGAASKKYEAVVWEKLDGTKQLTSFQPVWRLPKNVVCNLRKCWWKILDFGVLDYQIIFWHSKWFFPFFCGLKQLKIISFKDCKSIKSWNYFLDGRN